jgi:DNA gyrase/topoisomerase IV subunit A
VRVFAGRNSVGVRGIRLGDGDHVISMAILQFILTLSERGFGKRTSAYEYRVSGRGGKGIAAMVVNERNGQLVASFPVEDERPDHAGDGWRTTDPLPGQRHPHCRALDARRHRVPHGARRKGRVGQPDIGRRQWRRRR